MSHNVSEPSPPSSVEHDSHHDAHVHGLRLVLGSILAPKRPSPPSHTGSHPASGTASPFHHWHQPGAAGSGGSSSEQDSPPLPSPQSHPSPIVPHYHSHHQAPYQHAHHQPTPTPHPHLNAHHQHHSHHVHPQPQSHTHAHAYGPSRLSFTVRSHPCHLP
ncbi:hypothetical protein BJV77DRAFT_676895 [Russula vinacea]|nr:hypothetical protein BJV77DRAFT_676895 [Russula vinacea]